jgi:ADP-ribose pyrophosphatase YjhB (NUDIX family)
MDNAFRIEYCPVCGARVEQRQIEGRLRPVCTKCGRIHFADPKVAAAVLLDRQGAVLLVRRANQPERGRWTLPAGYVDAGEDPRVAAQRECREETGLEIRILAIHDVLFEAGPDRPATIVIVYKAVETGGVLAPGDDASEVGFFHPENLPAIGFESTRRAIAAWAEDNRPGPAPG